MKNETKIRSIQVFKHLVTIIPLINQTIDFLSKNVKIAAESKINLLISYLKDEYNEEENIKELLEEINANEEVKAIATHIMQKTILSSELEKIKIFLLTKILIYNATKKNNDPNEYIYQNLLTTTEILTERDYYLIYEIEENNKKYFNKDQTLNYVENQNYIKKLLKNNNHRFIYNEKNKNDDYNLIYSTLKRAGETKIFIQKMLSLGYFINTTGMFLDNSKEDYYKSNPFEINNTYEVIANYIKEYFEKYSK
jgi:hypothetical protein